jgi:hypothetical protein
MTINNVLFTLLTLLGVIFLVGRVITVWANEACTITGC